jgi:hypothetical protein
MHTRHRTALLEVPAKGRIPFLAPTARRERHRSERCQGNARFWGQFYCRRSVHQPAPERRSSRPYWRSGVGHQRRARGDPRHDRRRYVSALSCAALGRLSGSFDNLVCTQQQGWG